MCTNRHHNPGAGAEHGAAGINNEKGMNKPTFLHFMLIEAMLWPSAQ